MVLIWLVQTYVTFWIGLVKWYLEHREMQEKWRNKRPLETKRKEQTMLVLSRKNLESLYIKVPMPDGAEKVIKVQVVGTGKMVRIGVEADRDVIILREELLEGKVAEIAK